MSKNNTRGSIHSYALMIHNHGTMRVRTQGGPQRSLWIKIGWNNNTSDTQIYLGGGFKYFLFSPLLGEMIQFDSYFSTGLVQPPTSYIFSAIYKGPITFIYDWGQMAWKRRVGFSGLPEISPGRMVTRMTKPINWLTGTADGFGIHWNKNIISEVVWGVPWGSLYLIAFLLNFTWHWFEVRWL